MATVSEYADAIMLMVRHDMNVTQQVDLMVASFGELNDYVDANTYLEQAGVPYGTDLPYDASDPEGVRVVAAVCDEVSRRLAAHAAESQRVLDAFKNLL